jgi:hypothetical protein
MKAKNGLVLVTLRKDFMFDSKNKKANLITTYRMAIPYIAPICNWLP